MRDGSYQGLLSNAATSSSGHGSKNEGGKKNVVLARPGGGTDLDLSLRPACRADGDFMGVLCMQQPVEQVFPGRMRYGCYKYRETIVVVSPACPSAAGGGQASSRFFLCGPGGFPRQLIHQLIILFAGVGLHFVPREGHAQGPDPFRVCLGKGRPGLPRAFHPTG